MSTTDKAKRVVRPLTRKDLLKAEERPGFVRQWVYDHRVDDYVDGGWEPVRHTQDNKSRKDLQRGEELGASLITVNAGLGDKLVLVEIPEEDYRPVIEHRIAEAEKAIEGIYSRADEEGFDLRKNRGVDRHSFQ